MNIAVLCGGISPERNVSIKGGKSVAQALIEKGHNVTVIDPALGKNCIRNIDDLQIIDSPPTLEELASYPMRNMLDCVNSDIFDNIELAFLVLHGKNGEDGIIQALLEARGIPYTGSGIKASAVGIDKNASKMIFAASGIPTPPWMIADINEAEETSYLKEIRSELGSHLVIKPNDQGSSIGFTLVENGNLDDIQNGIKEAYKYSDTVLIERFIEGRELTVSIVGKEALPIIEIIPHEGYYDYKNKYVGGRTDYICPADLSDDIAEFTQNMALTAYNAVDCAGFGRVDFRLDEDGQPWILEVNTIPGFTSTSLVPKAAKEVGVEFGDLCQHIIDLTLGNDEGEDDE